MDVQNIVDLQDPRLDTYRSLKTTNDTRGGELLIAEGTTLVERVLTSGYVVRDVLVSKQKFVNFKARIPEGTTVFVLDRSLAAELVGYSFHSGVLCAAYRRRQPTLADLIQQSDSQSLVLFGDHLIDRQNVGLLIRIAAAYGASAVVLNSGCADPFSRRVLRISMGNGLQLPILEVNDSAQALFQLKSAGYQICATVLDSEAVDVSEFRYSPRTVLIFGNETHGVCPELQAAVDARLTIPMWNGTDSLNVSIAAGIFAHTFRQQQSRSPK